MKRKLHLRLLLLLLVTMTLVGLASDRPAADCATQETCAQCISRCQAIYNECVGYGEDPYICRAGRTQCVGECPCG